MEVTPEATPNPNAIKFTLDRPSTEGKAQTVREGTDPSESPLGARLFALDGVTNVFLVSNFVSVTKDDATDWQRLAPEVIAQIEAHFGESGMSPTGVLFSYIIGLIFAVGGIVFLIGLDNNRYLYGIPYLVLGVLIIGGVAGSQRRMKRKREADEQKSGPSSRSPY